MTPEELFFYTRELLIVEYGKEFLNLDKESQNNMVLATLRGELDHERGGLK